MIHESDIKKYLRCDKYYWFSKQKKIPFIPFATANMDINELVCAYFELDDAFIGKKGDDPNLAIVAYNQQKCLINARITYRELRITIPCLLQRNDQRILYLVYSQCYPKVSEAEKIHDLLFVMKKNHMQVDEIHLLHVNANYIREKEFNVHECLVISDEFYNEKNKKCGNIMDYINNVERDLDDLLDKMENIQDMSQVQKKRSSICTTHYKCEFFQECFPDNNHDTSILNLVQSSKKYDCIELGITDMAEVVGDEIEASRMQYAQVMAAKKQGLFVDKFALRGWLNKIQYPITYLDFEWQTYIFPPYEKMKPYDVLCFQYSMHIEEENQPLRHEQYIGLNDCRIEFIEKLISTIPKTGTILVFNAQGAEALRLQQLAKQYPQYQEILQSIWERMIDLALPFSVGVLYDQRMRGEYNLKKLLSLFSDYSYEDLEINQGLMAVKKYRELEVTHSLEIQDALYKYCGMDTYAEYVLYHYLVDLVK
ncbi:MAG: DUF2779 domain-containing protein [Traorella sp.]